MDNFADWLKEELRKRNWKQADLAQRSGLDSAVVSNIINGKRKAGETTIPAIARALQIPVKLAFEKAGLIPPETELTPKQRELMEKLKGLDDVTVQLAIDVLEISVKNRQRQIPNNINPKTTPR